MAPTNAQANTDTRLDPDADWNAVHAATDQQLASMVAASSRASMRARTRALLTQAERNLKRSFTDARAQLAQAQEQIQQLNTATDEAAFATALRCQISYRLGESSSAGGCADLQQLQTPINHPLVAGFCSLTRSFILSRDGQHDNALRTAELADRYAIESGDHSLIANTQNAQGVHYNIERLPKLALYHYETAWEHAEQTSVPELQQGVQFNLASVYSQLGRHNDALPILQRAINWPMATVSATHQILFRAVMAYTLIGVDRAEQAEQQLLEVLPALARDVQADTSVEGYNALAQSQLAQGKISLALQSFETALQFSTAHSNPRKQSVLVPYASALRQAERLPEALSILEPLVQQLRSDSPNQLLHDALMELGTIRASQNDFAAVATITAQAATVQEQLNNVLMEHQLSRLKTSSELQLRNQQLAVARQSAALANADANRETMLRYISLLAAALALLVGNRLRARRQQRKVMQAERTANERLELEVEARTQELEDQLADRLEAEVERRNLLGKLAEGEKMRALGQLTAGVAHDFNNLMTTVTLTAEYLKDTSSDNPDTDYPDTDYPDTDRAKERLQLLDDILSATDSAARITGGLLAYARQQPLQPEVLALDQFLEESTLIFRNTLGERNLLQTSFVPCKVKVDQGQLASALLNLLLNAKEALGERGTVQIKLSVEPTERGESAVISVRDSGRGMSAQELQRATEPFYTTKSAGSGAGLGLSMVHGFAHQSGGDLQLLSAPDSGTTIRLRLPLVTSNNESVQSATNQPPIRLPAELQVLVVEDREPVLNMLKLSLKHLGVNAIPASSADAAMERITRDGLPDLLLSDIMMPGELDGQALVEQVRATAPELPVVLMSGYSSKRNNKFVFLQKPFSVAELQAALLKALHEANPDKEPEPQLA